jgi:hypothetical protein
MPINNYAVINAGGFQSGPGPTMQDHYGWVRQGASPRDVVAINGAVNHAVRPVNCEQRFMPLGRCFSMLYDGTFVPGVQDTDQIPIACMLIGSHANSGDVVGVYRGGNPLVDASAFVPIKDEANAPFYCLDAGYIFETTEYDAAAANALIPGTPLTAINSMTDFDVAGKFTTGTVYQEHIVGVLISGPAPLGVYRAKNSIMFQGKVVPKLPETWLTLLNGGPYTTAEQVGDMISTAAGG